MTLSGEGSPQRNPRRADAKPKHERGLPEPQTIRDLAATYLEVQHRLWSDTAAKGALPANTPAVIDDLAQQFKDRFIDLSWRPGAVGPGRLQGASIALTYLRYSCDNSNPRSLPQQLRNCLERARRDGAFIPWEFVFADAAVTGTTAARRAYEMAKLTVMAKPQVARALYVDDLGRAARDAIETLTLRRMVVDNDCRLIGVSDGIDSSSPQSKLQVGFQGIMQEDFSDQLRAKVQRGREDAFREGRNIHSTAFGYKIEYVYDHAHNVRIRPNGKPETQRVIDKANAKWVQRIFRLYVKYKLSPGAIARRLNDRQAGGKRTWDSSTISQMLRRSLYRGVEFTGMTKSTRHPVTGKYMAKPVPESEWRRREVPALRIVDDELWDQAQRRLKLCSEAFAPRRGKGPSRRTVYPTTLFQPVCGYCRSALVLGHSGEYPSFRCPVGIRSKRGCKIRGYKSVKIFDTVLLQHVQEQLFTPAFLSQLVATANEFLQVEAAKPVQDEGPWRKKLANRTAQSRRLMTAIELSSRPVEQLVEKLEACRAEIEDVQRQLAARRVANTPAPPPISAEEVERLVVDLPALLKGNVKVAAPILAEVLGPIEVTVLPCKKGDKPVWQARFSANLTPIVAHVAAYKQYPSAPTWEYLNLRRWILPADATVPLVVTPQHRLLAPGVLAMAEAGASIQQIAAAHGICWSAARDVLEFARTGKLPDWTKRPWSGGVSARAGDRKVIPKYVKHAQRVVELVDGEKLSNKVVAQRIREETGEAIAPGTVMRAYCHAHQAEVQRAAAQGERFARPTVGTRLPPETVREIRRLLASGISKSKIARAVGCGTSTVYREEVRMREENGGAEGSPK